MPGPEAGPSRPRKTSTSSLNSPAKSKFRDSNERVNLYEYASTATSRPANAYNQGGVDSAVDMGDEDDDHRLGGVRRERRLGDEDGEEEDLPGYTAASGVRGGAYPDMHGDRKDIDADYGHGQEPLLGPSRDYERGVGGSGDEAYDGGRRARSTDSRRSDGAFSLPHSMSASAASGSGSLSLEQRKARWWRSTLITGIFVLSWYGFATLLSLYNKWMFSPQYYNFPYPLFVTACHMIVQFAISSMIRVTLPERYRPAEKPTRRDYAGKIFPTAVSTAGDIGLSNLSLRTITLSLYTMCKASALIFVLIFAFIFHLESYSLRLLSVISLISVGVFFMVYDTTAVNVPGIIMVFSASALAGLRWALTETLMKKRNMGMSNPFATIFWLAPLMGAVLIPVSLGVEGWGNVFGSGHWDGMWQAAGTALVIVFPGGLAFAMVASEYFIIDRAGILPLSIAGVVKEVSTISISAWVFGDQLTRLNIVGVVIAVCGIALYSFHKYQKSMSDPEDSHSHSHSQTPRTPGGAYALAPSRDSRHLHSTAMSIATPHTYPPGSPPSPALKEPESAQDRVDRLRDEFEGWNGADADRETDVMSDSDGDGEGGEAGEDEVQKRRQERIDRAFGVKRRGRWGAWWDREVW